MDADIGVYTRGGAGDRKSQTEDHSDQNAGVIVISTAGSLVQIWRRDGSPEEDEGEEGSERKHLNPTLPPGGENMLMMPT